MNIADLMRICLEFDQQQLTSRPSPWGRAAETLLLVARAAEEKLGAPLAHVLGDYRKVSTSAVRRAAPDTLDQPTLALVEEVSHWKTKAEAALAVLSVVSVQTDLSTEKIKEALELAEQRIRDDHPIEGDLLRR